MAGGDAAARRDDHRVAGAARAIATLRAEIRALGPVNVDALEELTEERTRFDFLSGQVADLEAAEKELRHAIVELGS